MIQFCVSAPGKVILYGEHAVVYGKTAVAASVDLRTVLKFAEVTQNIEISFPKLDLSLTLSLTKVKDYFFSDSFVYRSEDHELLYHRVQQFVASMNYSTSQQKSSLEALFYSLVCICHEENIELRPFRVHVETQLSLSSGLGSSASFAVCLVSCFLHWSYLQKTCSRSPSTSSKNGFDTADLEKVSRYAFNCERIIHGTPSGIDNSICTYGSMIEFRRGEPIKLISEVPKLNILLVNTKVERSTKALVQRLAELKVKYPGIVDPILDSIDAISREAVRVIDNISKLSNQFSSVEKYKELMVSFVTLLSRIFFFIVVLLSAHSFSCAEAVIDR